MAEQQEKKVPEVETVTMSDGRKVDFVGKRQMLKEYSIDDAGNVSARFDFRNGETRSFVLPPALVLNAAGHGVLQKVGDSTAGVKNLDDAVLAVEDTIKQLQEGNWNVKRESGGFSGAGVVVRALMEKTGKSQEEVKTFIEKKIADSGSTRQAIYASFRASSALAPIIQRLEAESAKKASKIDAEAALSELEAA